MTCSCVLLATTIGEQMNGVEEIGGVKVIREGL